MDINPPPSTAPSSPRRSIQRISDAKNKALTFNRRRLGLIKKAHELSVLCDAKVVVMIFDSKNACHVYSSEEPEEQRDALLQKFLNKDFVTVDPLRNINPNIPSDESLHNWRPKDKRIASVTTYSAQPSNNCSSATDSENDFQSFTIKSSTTYHTTPTTASENKKIESITIPDHASVYNDLPLSPTVKHSFVSPVSGDYSDSPLEPSSSSSFSVPPESLNPTLSFQHNDVPQTDNFIPFLTPKRQAYGQSSSRADRSSVRRSQSFKNRRNGKPRISRLHTSHASIDGLTDFIQSPSSGYLDPSSTPITPLDSAINQITPPFLPDNLGQENRGELYSHDNPTSMVYEHPKFDELPNGFIDTHELNILSRSFTASPNQILRESNMVNQDSFTDNPVDATWDALIGTTQIDLDLDYERSSIPSSTIPADQLKDGVPTNSVYRNNMVDHNLYPSLNIERNAP
ncbi:DNA-binding transcription factor, MADS-box Mbx1 [Schizosaccharomyces pombe]|uniref:MADS-box transcription factor 1 n=1 Tax=Schizosaccharomyces pombe (strain 972 / ATCC 24843) TaxID=284812 RepID=MBX1_SCHPO|nr:MADS-box transcription factor Mbx1 [Schizosaccharomyces pombe]O42954.2 RecName: Full=MADS-box transcription factor 1 [Schizosaccharomyces pombe 972h-]CAA17060.2 MADS-box transcription factor Mbx1 [Schizosaccharomyces pombe]|eukprot:NP_001342711.1 MADS-box transcription factor Mbx1 [Schizosaccharomyces pombe]